VDIRGIEYHTPFLWIRPRKYRADAQQSRGLRLLQLLQLRILPTDSGSDGTRNQLTGARGKHVAQTVNKKFYLSVKHPVACGGAGEEWDPHLLAQDLCTKSIKQDLKLTPVTVYFSIIVRFLTHVNRII
jgi:hypothetical protein